MLGELVQRAFAAGEISPNLFGRTELEKYDFALALAQNWFVDFRGGLSTRPGTEFVDLVWHDDLPTKYIPFEFGSASFSSYALLFGHNYIRFIQDGSYVLETVKAITAATKANPGVLTINAHGYAVGDWIKIFDVGGMTQLNERTFAVSSVPTGNTLTLKDALTGVPLDTSAYGVYTAGGGAYRIYTVTTTYDSADLDLLHAEQNRSIITLTHQLYPTKTLTRTAATNWVLATKTYGATLAAPTGVTIAPSTAGTAGVVFAVTAVDAAGEESLPSPFAYNALSVNYAAVAGSAKVTWTGVTGAHHYNIYRSQIIPIGADISRAMQVGLVGVAYGTAFTDYNIVPDFTEAPPNHFDPFANLSITYIQVTAGGAGYTRASVVSASGGGTGFEAYPVVDAGGTILGIVIVNGGQNYVAPVISVTVGAGATFVATTTLSSGNYPGVSATFQQRKTYAGSVNDPLTVTGSRPGKPDNMDFSFITQADDSFSFDIDSPKVAPIRHLKATRSGLLIMSEAGLWQLAGGNGVAVSPTNAVADPQNSNGISTLVPLDVETDLLYQESKGGAVRLLTYNDTEKVFKAGEVSLFSSHLVPPEKPIVAWDYAQDPGRVVHAVRSDGRILLFTIIKDQNLFGWTQQETKGLYTDCITIQEGSVDVTYFMVQRLINGRYTKFIEKEVRRYFLTVEDAWCVDCGLALPHTYPAADISVSASSGAGVVITASAGVFVVGDVGKILRTNGGKIIVTARTDATHLVGTVVRELTDVLPQDALMRPLVTASGSWTLDAAVTSISNLWHLEGETVSILADGNVLTQKVVTGGGIVLDTAATQVFVGLPYTCLAQTLPPKADQQTIDGKVKRIVKVSPRVLDSRGLQAGQHTDLLEEFRERGLELMGEPTVLQSGMRELFIEGVYELDATLYFKQTDPLPSTLLGFVQKVDIGDG